MTTHRAVVFTGPHALSVESVARPTIEAPTDVIVRTVAAALCGSDLHPLHGHKPCDPGTVFGHELVGIVDEIGPGVASLRLGDRVMCPFSAACGVCTFCLHGLSARCTSGQLLGFKKGGLGLHGAQAEFVRIPLADSTLVVMPASLHVEDGLLLGDIFSTAVFCAANAGLAGGGTPFDALRELVAGTALPVAAVSSTNGVGAEVFLSNGPTAGGLSSSTATGTASVSRPPAAASADHLPLVYVVVGCGPVGLLTLIAAGHMLRLRGYEVNGKSPLSPSTSSRIDGIGEKGNTAPHQLGGSVAERSGIATHTFPSALLFAIDSVPERLVVAESCGGIGINLTDCGGGNGAVADTNSRVAAAIKNAVEAAIRREGHCSAVTNPAVFAAAASSRTSATNTNNSESTAPSSAPPPSPPSYYGADAVMECVGAPPAIALSFSLLRCGGTMASVGIPPAGAPFPFTPGEAYDKVGDGVVC